MATPPRRRAADRPGPRRFLTLLSVVAVVGACATIPRAAPELSTQLTGRIQETRAAHIQVVRMYMDQRRKEVDQFIEREWVPTFTRELVQLPAVAAEWEAIVRSNDATRRNQFMAGLAPRLQAQINAKRLELMQPLDEAERAITRHLEDHYNQMLAMNATLTGLLEAGANATATQQQIVTRLDPRGRLPEYLDTADQLVQRLLDTKTRAEERKAQIDALLDALRRTGSAADQRPR